jgi:hypothetical protein
MQTYVFFSDKTSWRCVFNNDDEAKHAAVNHPEVIRAETEEGAIIWTMTSEE